jgi:hypothetical protein
VLVKDIDMPAEVLRAIEDKAKADQIAKLMLGPGGYDQVYRDSIPTTIDIFSAKADITVRVSADATLEAGGEVFFESYGQCGYLPGPGESGRLCVDRGEGSPDQLPGGSEI